MPTHVTPLVPTVVRTGNLSADATRFIAEQARAAIEARGFFRLGLSGGNTPRAVYAELAQSNEEIAWPKIQITFGDERCVPPDHSDSNYRMARESLFDHVLLPAGNIFRIQGELPPEEAATDYESRLSAVAARLGEPRYTHDLLLLGLGEDGHTASLFPGSPALEETARNVIPTIGPKPPPQRVTMTFPLINASRHVCFITGTAGKENIIEAALKGDHRYPAGRARPGSGAVTWLIGK